MSSILSYIKFSYHFVVFIFLCFVALFFHLPQYISTILIVLALVHLYDCWWFYHNAGDAPI